MFKRKKNNYMKKQVEVNSNSFTPSSFKFLGFNYGTRKYKIATT